jgi:hypothetical protein
MNLFSIASKESAAVGDVPALRISTKYMENFLPLRSVSSGTEIHTQLNSSGALDIYSVGTDTQVYRYRRSKDQIAPYDEVNLGISASQLYLFEPAGGDPDTPAIFGLDSKGKMTLATWHDGGYGQRSTGPDADVIRRFRGVRGTTGRIYINVVVDDGRLGVNYYDPQTDKWGGSVWAPVKGPDGKDAKVKEITTAANNPVQSALFAIGMDDEVLFAEDSFRTSQLRKLNKKASHIAAIADAENLLNIFAVERDSGLLWVKRQRKYSTGGIQFEDWVQVEPGQRGKLGRLHANVRRDNLMEVFALDDQGDLRYTRQTTNGQVKATGWQVLFPIAANRQNAIFTVGRDKSGYSEAYSVTPDNQLFRFWQAPQTGQWFSELIDAPRPEDKLISVPTHATEITVVDESGAPWQFANITINAAFLTTLWVNGNAYRSSIVDPVSLKADVTGKLVVLQRANALAATTLIVSTPLTPAGQPFKVEPNAQLQARMSGLTTKEILDAKDKSGQYLLPTNTKDRDEVANSIREITRQSMDIAQADELASAIQYKYYSPRATGFQLHSNFASLGDRAWEIDFSSGVPIYRQSDMASVMAFRAQHAHLGDDLGGFLGIDWGNVWDGIKDGVNWIIGGLEKIIVSIVNGIATVLFKIAGKVFEAVIKFAQQAFDLVQGVWNWLKVKLEQIYEWLAFLFNFKDFARTADGVKHTVGVFLDVAADAVDIIKDKVDAGFDRIKGNLKSITNQLIATLNEQGDPAMGNYFNQKPTTEEQQNASDHNIFFNALQENQGSIDVRRSGLRASASLDNSLEALMNQLKSLSDNFEFGDGKQAFEEAWGYFDNIGNDPNKALQLILSGVVKVLEGVALFALDFAKGVVNTILDLVSAVIRAFRDALFEEWEIPIFSQLYELFTGDKLTVTPVSVIAWVVAIPMTIGAKVILKRAPWTEQQLQEFKQTFTADMLRQRMGIPMTGTRRQDLADSWNPQWRENFLTGYCFVMAIRALAEPGGIIANGTGAGLGPAGIVPVALRFLGTCFTAPWALSPAAGAPSCTPGEAGFGVTNWICQMCLGPIRGGLVHYQPWITGEAKITTAEVTLTLWGVANLMMTSWNFAKQERTTANKLAFSRSILNIVPGQTLHFLALPALNKPLKIIPAGILAALTLVSFFGSMGVAIAEIHTTVEMEPELEVG